MDFKIVFIDDNLTETEPLVQNIRKNYKGADYNNIFKNPDEGLAYVLSNLDNKMIVFIDWNFSGNKKRGIDLLKEIRKKTSLLYIVMMSANQLPTDMPLDSIIEMMNEDNFFYLDRSNNDFLVVKSIIDKIQANWETKFDCILEQWLIRHPEDNNKEAFTEAATGKVYTWTDILSELRRQTAIGKSFEQKLNEFYIYQINRSKK
ncbi:MULTISPECIES: hypothetical protein [Prevotella]|uniref:Response regulator n=1 Tax=Prevotella melaninogenica TaxID=28132 RepID=A0ABX7XSU8_9BACT|nr:MULTISPECIES: hypothetical protein [Prevotella]QUB76690.1 hypothetical protein J5A58_13400 [Prevotella melaninogenica]